MSDDQIRDELIGPKDFIIFTDDESLVTTSEPSGTVKGTKLKPNIKFAPGDAIGVGAALGAAMKAFAPSSVGGSVTTGTLGKAYNFVMDNQEFLKLAGEDIVAMGKEKLKQRKERRESGKGKDDGKGTKAPPAAGKPTSKREPSGSLSPDRNNWGASDFTNIPPLRTTINTPITKRPISEDLASDRFLEPTMHITGMRFQFQTASEDDVIYKWFKEVVAPDFQNLASISVNYGLNAEQVFSTNNMIEYFNLVAYALQVYYFYGSIISYETNIPHNKNTGMRWMRNKITQQNIYELETLSRRLRCLPIPPRINEVAFFLSQSFKMRDVQFASICKFMPFGFNATTSSYPSSFGYYDSNGSMIQNCIDNLSTSSVMTMTSKLANIIPDWLDMTMYSPGPAPVFNNTLCDIWANAPMYNENYSWSTVNPQNHYHQVYPCWDTAEVADKPNYNYRYVSYSDNPDSIATALFTGFESGFLLTNPTAPAISRPGLLTTTQSTYQYVETNKFRSANFWIFVKTDNSPEGEARWHAVNDMNGYNCIADAGRAISNNRDTSSIDYFFHARPVGTCTVQYFTLANVRWSTKQLVEWMVNLETLKEKAEIAIKKRQPYNSKGAKLKVS